MGEQFGILDILIFAGVALFLIYRLGTVLGKRTGHQNPTELFGGRPDKTDGPDKADGSDNDDDDTIVQMPKSRPEPQPIDDEMLDGPLGPGLTQIKLADPLFDPDQFVDGSKIAFEMVLDSYSQGDVNTLRQLLNDDVYDNFYQAIQAREAANQRLEETLVGIDTAELIEARLEDYNALLTVKFISQQVNALYDADGQVIEGNPNEVVTVTDIWTFQRNTRDRDPNWVLIETRSSN